MENFPPEMWNVLRVSTTTGKVLKHVAGPWATRRDAELWLEGFGQDESTKTQLRIVSTKENA